MQLGIFTKKEKIFLLKTEGYELLKDFRSNRKIKINLKQVEMMLEIIIFACNEWLTDFYKNYNLENYASKVTTG